MSSPSSSSPFVSRSSLRSYRLLLCLALVGVTGCRKFLFGETADEPRPAVTTTPPVAPQPPPTPPPCGEEGQPECPLQTWMDRNLNDAITTKSGAKLERAFAELASFEPPDYEEWSEFADIGRSAAARGDLGTVGRICTACHDKYRHRYRLELRGRPLPSGPSSSAPAPAGATAP
jgi:cytochrome c556